MCWDITFSMCIEMNDICAFLPHSVLAMLEYWRVTLGYFRGGVHVGVIAPSCLMWCIRKERNWWRSYL